jgi:hypothetical protein
MESATRIPLSDHYGYCSLIVSFINGSLHTLASPHAHRHSMYVTLLPLTFANIIRVFATSRGVVTAAAKPPVCKTQDRGEMLISHLLVTTSFLLYNPNSTKNHFSSCLPASGRGCTKFSSTYFLSFAMRDKRQCSTTEVRKQSYNPSGSFMELAS